MYVCMNFTLCFASVLKVYCRKIIKKKWKRYTKKNFFFKFIEVYRNLPALWQIKSKSYSNRIEKNAQLEILLNKYEEKCPIAEKKNVKRHAYRKKI